MRRFLLWVLPLAAALVAVTLFAFGFVSYLRGDRGDPVDVPAQASTTTTTASRAILKPIILGDSLARGTGDESGLGIPGRLDAELRQRGIRAQRTYNLAVNGARTNDLLRQLDSANVQQLVRDANVVIVSIGGNDLWGGTDWRNVATADAQSRMNGVLDRIDAIVKKIRAANPKARIFFIGLYNPFITTPAGAQLSPLVNRWNALLVEHFESDANFTVVQTSDLFSHRDRLSLDRFHPAGEGYELIARRIADAF